MRLSDDFECEISDDGEAIKQLMLEHFTQAEDALCGSIDFIRWAMLRYLDQDQRPFYEQHMILVDNLWSDLITQYESKYEIKHTEQETIEIYGYRTLSHETDLAKEIIKTSNLQYSRTTERIYEGADYKLPDGKWYLTIRAAKKALIADMTAEKAKYTAAISGISKIKSGSPGRPKGPYLDPGKKFFQR